MGSNQSMFGSFLSLFFPFSLSKRAMKKKVLHGDFFKSQSFKIINRKCFLKYHSGNNYEVTEPGTVAAAIKYFLTNERKVIF